MSDLAGGKYMQLPDEVMKLRSERNGFESYLFDAFKRQDELVSQMRLFTLHGVGSFTDFDWREYEALMKHIKSLALGAFKFSVCRPLVKLIGEDLHDFYQTRYPINRETQVSEWALQYGHDRIYYTLPMPPQPIMNFNEPLTAAAMSVSMPEHREAHFETIADTDDHWARLAYAPEINTVYVAR